MKKLFYDIQITGHHSEYISHLVDYIYDNPDEQTYIFVLHPEFSLKFQDITTKAQKASNIMWIEVSIKEHQKCQIAKSTKRSFAEYQLMNLYAQKFRADHVVLLNYNVLQIATIYKRSNYSLSGIYFAPYPRMQLQSLKSKIVYFRKIFRARSSVRNSQIKTLFVLNDQKTTDHLNKSLNTSIFKMLPDPIPMLSPLVGFDIYEHYKIEKSRNIFLHLGALRSNKGTLEIVESVKHMPQSIKKMVAILIVGKTKDEQLEQQLNKSIAWIKENTAAIVIWDNIFAPNEMMKSLFEQSFSILMPYKSAEASSGILGHAANSKKPVIASGNGLIGELVKENKLGITLEQVTSENISFQIQRLLEEGFSTSFGFEKHVNDNSKALFAKRLLDINER